MYYIIVNPAAGGGRLGKKWPFLEQALQESGLAYTVQFTQSRGHAIRLVEDAVLRGHRQFIGVGGDGTHHEITNGILTQSVIPPSAILYAPLPFGTGNDWARMYGFSADLKKRLHQIVHNEPFFQDVGLVEYVQNGQPASRYFINVAGMAYDAFVVKKSAETASKIRSRLHYLMLLTRYLFDYEPTKAIVRFDDQIVEDHFYTINIGICRYSGGGMQLVPHAVPDDGLLALTLARQMSKAAVMLQTHRFYNGSIFKSARVSGFQTQHITVEHSGSEPMLLEADGEFLGNTPVQFSILKQALKIV